MPVRVLFLAGMGRSGTTLLERVIAGIPGAVGLGEVVHLWQRGVRDDERCGCGLVFSRCSFWQQVGASAFGGWDRVDVDAVQALRGRVDRVRHVPALLRRSPARDLRIARDAYAAAFSAVYRAAAEVAGATVVIDSSKQASLPHVLAAREDIDLRVVHCVRDARAVCYAWTKRVERPDTVARASYMAQYSPRTMARMWASHNAAVELVRLHGVPVMRLRYEDFLADPVPVSTELARFAGLPAGPGSLRHIRSDQVQLPVTHSAAGNPLRFMVGPVPLRRDDVWQAAFPARQRRLVTALTWPLLVRYGYPATSRTTP